MFNLPDLSLLRQRSLAADRHDVHAALRRGVGDIDALAVLLSPAAEMLLPQLAGRAGEITAQRFGKTTQIYAPLYLSNYCNKLNNLLVI